MINPSNINPVPSVSLAAPDGAPGLDYDAYRAAGGEGPTGKSFMNETGRGKASVAYHRGGSLSCVSFEEDREHGRETPGPHRGGGVRGRVNGLSRASRRNLLRRFAMIDRHAFDASGGRVLFVTLTYPGEGWPVDPGTCKGHMKSFLKRMDREYGDFAAYWRMGVQGRGAWHFHLILFALPPFGSVWRLRLFASSAWYEVCGKVSEGHSRAGTNVEEVRYWRRGTSYAERYLARKEGYPEGIATGRVWGTWREKLLPVHPEMIQVSLRDAHRIRRVYRRLAKRKGTGRLHGTTVFIRHENVIRLLTFLGYRIEENR